MHTQTIMLGGRKWSLRGAVMLAALTAWAPGARAARWDIDGGWVVNLDSVVSAGTAIRTSKTNCQFVGNDNGGCVGDSVTPLQKSNPAEFSASLDTLRLNQDDGDLNYKRWQPVSANMQWVSDLAIKGTDGWSGLFRGAINYDAAVDHTHRTDLDKDAGSFSRSNPRLLDAFITKDMKIAGHQTRFRVGNQVLSWGEDIYILGGINSVNPVYLPGSHSAGTSLKTLMTPAPMFSFNTALTQSLSLEAFYQWQWKGFVFDSPGTYFSTLDTFGKGGRAQYLPTSVINAALGGLVTLPTGYIGDNGTHIVGDNPQTLQPYNRQLTMAELADPQTNPVGPLLGTGTVIEKGNDHRPSAGQGGAALRYQFEGSGNELGAYYYRYADKIPFTSYSVVNNTNNPVGLELHQDYGQNRDMYGLSYNFSLWDWAIGTELSYRPRDGVAIDPSAVADSNSPHYCTNAKPVGTYCRGYIDTANYQFHVAGLHIVSPSGPLGWLLRATGASESVLTAEAAAGYYPQLKFNQGIPYAATNDYTLPTRTETGVVLQGSLTWPNVFGTRASLMPDLVISQGISGYSATYLPGFIKGAGAATLGVNIDFKTKPSLTMRVDATQNWGGGSANLLRDRDFASISFTTAF